MSDRRMAFEAAMSALEARVASHVARTDAHAADVTDLSARTREAHLDAARFAGELKGATWKPSP